jgi:protein SCO1/2
MKKGGQAMQIKTRTAAIGAALLLLPGLYAQSQFFNPARSQAPGEWQNPAGARVAELEGVAIDQKLNSQIDLDLEFVDSSGETVVLRELFRGKPVVLSLVYFECPMLCTLELNGLMKAMRAMELSAGKDYDVISVSFDPRETSELAARKKDEYMRQYTHAGFYDRERLEEGWRFLTGTEENIRALADAVGFRYRFDEKVNQYRHGSGIIMLTPQGKVSRYQFGVEYSPRDLKFALMEASEEKIGSPVDAVILYCFHYDPTTGKYGFVVMNALRLAGAATLLGLGGFIGLSFWRDRRQTAPAKHGEALS